MPEFSMVDISVQNIKKAFEEGKDILNELSFEITEGERVGLLGKNGAGKTTLFRIIAGLIEGRRRPDCHPEKQAARADLTNSDLSGALHDGRCFDFSAKTAAGY